MAKKRRCKKKNSIYTKTGYIPAGQFRKLGIPPWLFNIYKLIAERPTATNKTLMELTGYSETEVKQAIWRLRHFHKAIRPIKGHAICDLRLGHMTHRWGKTIKELVPVEEQHLYFNEDGTRKLIRDGQPILIESERAAFLTEMISGEILRYLLAEGEVKMTCWEYWDFAKKLGCNMRRIARPNQEALEDACKENERLRTTGKRVDTEARDGSGQGDPVEDRGEVFGGEDHESIDRPD